VEALFKRPARLFHGLAVRVLNGKWCCHCCCQIPKARPGGHMEMRRGEGLQECWGCVAIDTLVETKVCAASACPVGVLMGGDTLGGERCRG